MSDEHWPRRHLRGGLRYDRSIQRGPGAGALEACWTGECDDGCEVVWHYAPDGPLTVDGIVYTSRGVYAERPMIEVIDDDDCDDDPDCDDGVYMDFRDPVLTEEELGEWVKDGRRGCLGRREEVMA